MSRRPITRWAAAVFAALTAVAWAPPPASAEPAAGSAVPLTEPYRPQFHFTPARNWMNDPNGLVYYQGEYHLFYQYNPAGNQWGNMSWGHAVSKDLVHWRELPLAISHDADEAIFSGSVVVDRRQTSGFGSRARPAMVAVYTSYFAKSGKQAQSLAYSTDRGRTWTRYAGNPVLDIGSTEFRDPKVQWYAPSKSWLMTVSKSTEHKVQFYSSKNLKSWQLLSEFGPAGAVGGVWECPDLFALPVDGNPRHRKWVLVVNINPGGLQGGSAAQYFIGEFDGKKFTADDDGSYTAPAGAVVQDFEQPDFGTWTATGTAFGAGPTAGDLDGQTGVTGYAGRSLANSFHGGDGATGTLTSSPFPANTPYLNFLVGGGAHPHDPNTVLDPAPPTGTVVADFEGPGYGGWTATGEAFGTGPAQGSLAGQQEVTGFQGTGLVNSFLGGDATVGTLTSPEVAVTADHLNFLIGGGRHPMSAPDPTAVNLLVGGKVVRTATGSDTEALNWASWDVREFAGQQARIQVVDQNTGGWGHLNLDQILLSDTGAQARSTETAVNLLVDGKVVQSATGANSEALDWASFDLRAYAGKTVQVQLADANTGGWGHLLADRFLAAGVRARSALERAHWVDYGKDYYAAVSWEDAPNGKRSMIGWMNNWLYAGTTPTDPWRGAQSVPREMALRTIDGKVRLTQQPVRSLNSLRSRHRVDIKRVTATDTSVALPRSRGKALDLEASFSAGDADRFGLKVRTGPGQETVIGYDATTRELYVDRTRSGVVDFSPDFPGVQRAPLAARNGKVRLRILVDWSSVEVFSADGSAVITDQVFPDPHSDGVQLFAEGGSARLDSLSGWKLGSYRD